MSREDKLISFYKQCVNKGYTNMADDTQSLKAKVIAMDLGLRYRRIENLFEEAKDMYEDERAWQAKKRQQWEAEQEKILQEKKRLATDGEWFMTVYDYLSDDEKGTEVAFYRRPDNSIYYKENGGIKREGQPTFTVENVSTVFYNYHEGKTVYTGATVGGITTGGFHTEAPYMSEHKQYTGKGEIIVSYDGKSFEAKRVRFPAIVAERFHRDSTYKSHIRGGDYLLVASSIQDNKSWQSLMQSFDRIGQYDRLEKFSNAKADTLYSKDTCREIVKFLDRIVRGDYPKSDKERFESVANIPEDASAATLKKVIDELSSISGYSPADELRRTLLPRYEDVLQQEKEKKVLQRERTQKRTPIIITLVAIAIIAIIALFVVMKVIIPNGKYNAAVMLMENGQYDEAIAAFEALGNYRDSAKQLEAATSSAALVAAYDDAEMLLSSGNYHDALAAFNVLGDYKDSNEQVRTIREKIYSDAVAAFEVGDIEKAISNYIASGAYIENSDILDAWRERNAHSIAAGGYHSIGLKTDGTVVATGDNFSGQCNVTDWRNIVSVDTGYNHTIGLKADGTVVATGYNSEGQCDVSGWKNIVSVSTASHHTVGLKVDGTVVATGDNSEGRCNVSDWRNIVSVDTGYYHTIGLKADGTVVAAGANFYGQCNVSGWRNIVSISAGDGHTVGLKADGTVVATGDNSEGQCDVSSWRNIVAIAAGQWITVGLKADGTVVTVGPNGNGHYDVSDWRDIAAIAASDHGYRYGLKANGTVVFEGLLTNGRGEVAGWRNIKVPR